MKIRRLSVLWRSLRRRFNRSEFAIRLLRLSRDTHAPSQKGLVLIQVDGLAFEQLKRALANNRMPFLKRLIRKKDHELHRMYSGLPSTTPAVQAELFYGVKSAVPAFSFRDSHSGQVVRMFSPGAASEIEARLCSCGRPLMTGGSAYSNIFTGGASEEEAHFCSSALGLGPILRSARPFSLALLVLTNLYSFLRIFALLMLEFGLALWDALHGIMKGHRLTQEMKFVPVRVAIAVGLRELITIGAKIDIARGLPVVQLNFLGYDEQSHRRGPSSYFAHWGLKGIDDSIARIWRAAKGPTAGREYEVWIYSDHGQIDATSYHKIHGRMIEAAISDAFSELRVQRRGGEASMQYQRADLLDLRWLKKMVPGTTLEDDDDPDSAFVVTALGPVGLVYARRPLAEGERERLAEALAVKAKVPLVLVADGPGLARAWTEEGEFQLPRDRVQLLGADHPFLDAAAEDLVALAHHVDAGDMVICGWRHGARAINFAIENGSHGGASPEETSAFLLLPPDTRLPDHDLLRPLVFHEAALRFLGRWEEVEAGEREAEKAQ